MAKQYYSTDGSVMRPYKVKKNMDAQIAASKKRIKKGIKLEMSDDGKGKSKYAEAVRAYHEKRS